MERSDAAMQSLAEAANYVKVFTRPTSEQKPNMKKVQTGCFDCMHAAPNMSDISYWTFFGLGLMEQPDGKPPKFEQHFSFTMAFGDKAWEYRPEGWLRNMVQPRPLNWKDVPSKYVPVDAFKQGVDGGYMRLLRVGSGKAKHINRKIKAEELFVNINLDHLYDLLLVTQPNWTRGTYIDPNTDILDGQLHMDDMRFVNATRRQTFINRYAPIGLAVDLTPIKGSRKGKKNA